MPTNEMEQQPQPKAALQEGMRVRLTQSIPPYGAGQEAIVEEINKKGSYQQIVGIRLPSGRFVRLNENLLRVVDPDDADDSIGILAGDEHRQHGGEHITPLVSVDWKPEPIKAKIIDPKAELGMRNGIFEQLRKRVSTVWVLERISPSQTRDTTWYFSRIDKKGALETKGITTFEASLSVGNKSLEEGDVVAIDPLGGIRYISEQEITDKGIDPHIFQGILDRSRDRD